MTAVSYESDNFDTLFGWGGFVAFGLALVGFAVFQPLAKPDPQNSAAYGCYVAEAAPSILLDSKGMSIRQRGFPVIPFHLERHKTAITLTADAPIKADVAAGRYLYSMYHPGIGTFLDFQKIEGGLRYGQFDETQLSTFVMLARDYHEIVYNKASLDRC